MLLISIILLGMHAYKLWMKSKEPKVVVATESKQGPEYFRRQAAVQAALDASKK
jgi:hypothetical protein